jgi:uncharacterized protein
VEYNSKQIYLKGKLQEQANKRLLRKLKQAKDQQVDSLIHQAHDMVFADLDCLKCANCCKTTSPVFTNRDVDRIASTLKMRPGKFMDEYLKTDEDGDLVLKSSPCIFLEADHTCRIYDQRPIACKSYPHTNRKKVKQLLGLTMKNSLICPAVQEILSKIEIDLRNS